jgi:hypothetical protein
MKYKIFPILVLVLVISNSVSGQTFNEKRDFHKSFPVNKNMTLDVSNKYGTIQITNWNKDSVAVRVEIEASSSSLERLHRLFDGININLTSSSMQVRAESEFSQNIEILFESFKGMTKKIISYESTLQINYFISVPEYLDISISNKYGDIYMENNSGKLSLSLSNGSFKAGDLNESNQIELTFCDAIIHRLRKGYINASFSDVEIVESGELKINSISSHYDLKKAGKIETESRRDKLYIGTVDELRGNSYFTDYRINELNRELDLVPKYGSVNADAIGKGLDMININSSYSDLSLNFDPNLSYNLDVRQQNAFVVLPQKNSELEKKTISDDRKEYNTFGKVGRNPGNVKVSIDASHGNIYLK